jgi:hypothetical protein
MADFRQVNGKWVAPYETNTNTLAKQHPLLNTLLMGAPAMVQQAVGGIGNFGSLMASPNVDSRTDSEKGTEMAGYLQDRIGSGIGSSQGSRVLGVPTPSGTAPIWSMNLGGDTNKSLPIPQSTPQTRTQPQPRTVKQPSAITSAPKITGGSTKSKTKSTKGGGITYPANPNEEGLRAPLQSVGYGAYANGSPIENLSSDIDLGLMAGDHRGTLAMGPGGHNRLALNYTPEEIAVNHKETQALQTGVPSGAMDFRSGDQVAFDKKAQSDIMNPAPDFSKMTLSDLMALKQSLKTRTANSTADYHDAGAQNFRDTTALSQMEMPSKIRSAQSTANYHDIMGGVAALKAPSEIADKEADIRYKLEGQIPSAQALATNYMANSAKTNEETKWVGTEAGARALGAIGRASGNGTGTNATGVDFVQYADAIAKLQAQKTLTEDPAEKARLENLIINMQDILKTNAPKGTVPTRSPGALPSIYAE